MVGFKLSYKQVAEEGVRLVAETFSVQYVNPNKQATAQ